MPAIFSSSEWKLVGNGTKASRFVIPRAFAIVRDARGRARSSNKVESPKNRRTVRFPFFLLYPGIYTVVSNHAPWIIFGADFSSRSDESRVSSRRSCASCLVTLAMKIDRVVSTFVPGFLAACTYVPIRRDRVDRRNSPA